MRVHTRRGVPRGSECITANSLTAPVLSRWREASFGPEPHRPRPHAKAPPTRGPPGLTATRAPSHPDHWICLASKQLDIVVIDKSAFIARHDNPGLRKGAGAVVLRGLELGASLVVVAFGLLLLMGYLATERLFGA